MMVTVDRDDIAGRRPMLMYNNTEGLVVTYSTLSYVYYNVPCSARLAMDFDVLMLVSICLSYVPVHYLFSHADCALHGTYCISCRMPRIFLRKS